MNNLKKFTSYGTDTIDYNHKYEPVDHHPICNKPINNCCLWGSSPKGQYSWRYYCTHFFKEFDLQKHVDYIVDMDSILVVDSITKLRRLPKLKSNKSKGFQRPFKFVDYARIAKSYKGIYFDYGAIIASIRNSNTTYNISEYGLDANTLAVFDLTAILCCC